MRFLVLLFIALPIIEMLILIKVGGIIGALPTVALVVLTATLGVWLLKREGLATLNRVQARMNQGQLPETEMLEGIMLIVGGALLLTPGFVTDAIGFVCLLPFLRQPLAQWLIRHVMVIQRPGQFGQPGSFHHSNGSPFGESDHLGNQTHKPTPQHNHSNNIIDGEFTEEKKP